MATINIGNLAFTHKGDYDGSTAYAKNDVVYYSTNGNAYIAKQATTGNAPTNATYWNQFAQGSGGIWNAGLSLGSAGQAVKVNAAGNALEFGAVAGGKVLQAVINSATSNYTTTSSSFVYVAGMPSLSITPSATTSKVLLMFNGGGCEMNGGNGYVTIYRDSTDLGNSTYGFWQMQHQANYRRGGAHGVFIDTPSSTSAITYQLRMRNNSGNQIGFGETSKTNLIALEIGA